MSTLLMSATEYKIVLPKIIGGEYPIFTFEMRRIMMKAPYQTKSKSNAVPIVLNQWIIF